MKVKFLGRTLKLPKLIFYLILFVIIMVTANLSTTWGNSLSSPLAELPQHSQTKQADILPESEYQQEFHVSPEDLGYLAIKYLIQRYNCISLYADGHMGSRVELIRSEAVVDLNTCLDRAQNLIEIRVSQLASKSQIKTMQLRFQSLTDAIELLKRKNYVEN